MAEPGFTPNPLGIFTVTRSPDGLVGRSIYARALTVSTASKAACPRSSRTTGTHLADTIAATKPVADGAGVVCYVRATAPHALFVHEGTRPHDIVPRNARVLAFKVGGEQVFATRVRHPGTKGKKYLTDQLHLAAT